MRFETGECEAYNDNQAEKPLNVRVGLVDANSWT